MLRMESFVFMTRTIKHYATDQMIIILCMYSFTFHTFHFYIYVKYIMYNNNPIKAYIPINLCIHLSYLEDQRNLNIYHKNRIIENNLIVCLSASTTESYTELTTEGATNATNSTTSGIVPLEDDGIPKAFVAFVILAGAVIIGGILAKIVDVIHDRKSVNDDASDMSDYTRVLLKKRFALLAFKKSKLDGEEGEGGKLDAQTMALKLGKKWSLKASQRRLTAVLDRSDVEQGVVAEEEGEGTPADGLVAYTATSGLSPTAVTSTSCQVAASATSTSGKDGGKGSPNVLFPPTLPALQRVPSLAVDEFDDDVFYEDAVMEALYHDPPHPKATPVPAAVSGAPKTNSPSLTLAVVGVTGEIEDRTKTSTPQPPSQITGHKSPIPKPAASPIHSKADAWLFNDAPPDQLKSSSAKDSSPKDPNVKQSSMKDPCIKDTALMRGSPTKEGTGSVTTVRHDERPQSPPGEEESRPSNPVPPSSGATSPIDGGRVTPAAIVAVVAAAETDVASANPDAADAVETTSTSVTAAEDATTDKTKGVLTTAKGSQNKSRTADNSSSSARPKTANSKSASTGKMFQKAGPPVKRPQTGKKPPAGVAASSSVPKRPKTAGATAGPTRTGNRPVSSKPTGRGPQGGATATRNKSAKR